MLKKLFTSFAFIFGLILTIISGLFAYTFGYIIQNSSGCDLAENNVHASMFGIFLISCIMGFLLLKNEISHTYNWWLINKR